MSEVTQSPWRSADGARLREMIWGFISSQVAGAIAAFGLPDLIAEGTNDVDGLAAKSGLPSDSAYRLLRAGASLDLLREHPGRRFELTGMGDLLRTGVPGSMRPQAMAFTDPWQWAGWTYFRDALSTGESQLGRVFGVPLFAYLADHCDEQERFDQAMSQSSRLVGEALVRAYDFAAHRVVMDLGGGDAQLISQILEASPTTSGIIVEQAQVAAKASARLVAAGLAARCRVIVGDLFSELPPADAIVLKMILHDWSDEMAAQILERCRQALSPGGRVLLVEGILPPIGARSVRGHRSDLDMLVINGGRERTIAEFNTLAAGAGLAMQNVKYLADEWGVVILAHARGGNDG